jgi:HlyD family secretion protein
MTRSTVASVVGVAGLVCVAASVFGRAEEAPSAYRFASVEPGSIVSAVSASGTLECVSAAFVTAQTPGQVKEISAAVNDEVKAGQVLVRLDSDSAQARLDTALADLEVARRGVDIASRQLDRANRESANAEALEAGARADTQRAEVSAVDARRDLQRKRKLASSGDVAPADAEHTAAASGAADAGVASAKAHSTAAGEASAAARAEADVAKAQLDNAVATVAAREAAARQARLELSHTELRSPIDGVVVERNVAIGQSVGLAPNAPPLLAIAGDLRRLQLRANVAEADVGRVAAGQEATFVFDAFSNETFRGRVRSIAAQPRSAQSVVAYDVMIDADNPDRRLRPGMTAEVHIVTGRRDDVLKVPNAALRFRPASADAASRTDAAKGVGELWRLDRDGHPHSEPVNIGITDGVFTEVSGPVKKGDEVIVGSTQSNQAGAAGAHVGPLRF